jgi:hypothetical protein
LFLFVTVLGGISTLLLLLLLLWDKCVWLLLLLWRRPLLL